MGCTEKMRKALNQVNSATKCIQACTGFDGYIDTLYRVVKSRKSAQAIEYFSTIPEFAHRAACASGRSADMELQKISRRMGGNAPLMAEAMTTLGCFTRCVGTMGYPVLDDLFSPEQVHFSACTIAPSAASIAFEFSDGKLMFGDNAPLLTLNWERIRETVGLETLRSWYQNCDLWAIVNWSFLLHSNDIVEGFWRDILSQDERGEKRILFFDLADPRGRCEEDVLRLFALMKKINTKNRVVLSMNENESIQVASALGIAGESLSVQERAAAIREALGIYLASIHVLDQAAAATEETLATAESIFNPTPRISTGGGDHFNGGCAMALAHGLTVADALSFGNLVSSCYVSKGKSPDLETLAQYLNEVEEP